MVTHQSSIISSSEKLSFLQMNGMVMDYCGSYLKRKRHYSEQSSPGCSLEYTDLEAAEALVCMSSWGQHRPNSCKPRPLTPASDSCDSLLPPDPLEPPKDFVSLSSLVRVHPLLATVTTTHPKTAITKKHLWAVFD